jgi:hypothetical protein
LGLEVVSVAVRDVILPGDMKDLDEPGHGGKPDRAARGNGNCLLALALIEGGDDHRLADPEPLEKMLEACEGAKVRGYPTESASASTPMKKQWWQNITSYKFR